jgi:sulfur-oxidizing protein SoxZ
MAEPMRIRATMAGDVADVKVLMNHPMETGTRKDGKTGQLIPAHFIQEVKATINGKVVLDAEIGPAVSRNPFLGFRVKGAKAGDTVAVSWVDNKGDKNNAEAKIG